MRICVYFFIGIVISILLGIFLLKNEIILFCIALIFLAVMFFMDIVDVKTKMILIFISVSSFINIIGYYGIDIGYIKSQDFRVVDKISDDVILKSAKYGIRKYIIKDCDNSEIINIGMILNIDGKIVKQSYYDIGVCGEIVNYSLNEFRTDFIYKFYNMREIIKDYFIRNFGQERGNILSGLTFGDTDDIDKQYKSDIKSMGLSHILSVSGFHMNIVFEMISKILSIIPSIFVSCIYLFFTGTKVSGIRAFIMMAMKQLAPRIYRTYDGINVLFFSGTVILLLRPYEIFNMGLLYSFAATLGILMFNKKINDYLYKFPKIFSDSLSLVISAQIFILPIMILNNRSVGIRFLFSNMLLVPFYSFLIILGILFIFLNFIPIVKDFIVYIIKLIFDIIDGGIILIKDIVPNEVYLDESLIIFICCLYTIYFLRKYLTFNKIKWLVVILSSLLFLYLSVIEMKIEYGRYFDKKYVIIRNKFKSYMYVDKHVSDEQVLKDKFGTHKIFHGIDDEEVIFFGNDIYVNFEHDRVILKVNDRFIYMSDEENKEKYYNTIYPVKYHIVF